LRGYALAATIGMRVVAGMPGRRDQFCCSSPQAPVIVPVEVAGVLAMVLGLLAASESALLRGAS
jgi:hypothetical protein